MQRNLRMKKELERLLKVTRDPTNIAIITSSVLRKTLVLLTRLGVRLAALLEMVGCAWRTSKFLVWPFGVALSGTIVGRERVQ